MEPGKVPIDEYSRLSALLERRWELRPEIPEGVIYLVTVIFWGFWFYLVMPFVSLALWAFGVRTVLSTTSLDGYRVLGSALIDYSQILLGIAACLGLWILWNVLRYGGRRDRRSTKKDEIGIDELGESLRIDVGVLREMRGSRWFDVDIDAEGRPLLLKIREPDSAPQERIALRKARGATIPIRGRDFLLPALILAVLAAVAVGSLFFLPLEWLPDLGLSESERPAAVAERPRDQAAEPEQPSSSAVEVPETLQAPAEKADDEPPVVSSQGEPESTPSGDLAEPSGRPAAQPVDAVTSSPFDRVEDVSWVDDAEQTTFLVVTNGSIRPGSFEYLDLRSGKPRSVVKLIGMKGPVRPAIITMRTDHVQRVRFGFHPELSPSELHIVFDLRDESVSIESVEVQGRVLSIVLSARTLEAEP